MKYLVCLFILFSLTLKGQTFSLSDTTFKVNDIMRTYRIMPDINNNIYLMSESRPFLDSLAIFLIKNKTLVLEVGRYLDSRGEDQRNLFLTQSHANAVIEYLVLERGINRKRLISVGYGETEPIVSKEKIKKMKDPATINLAHRINRRTEFKILKTDYSEK